MEVELVVRDGADLEFESHVFPEAPRSTAAHANLVIVHDRIVETSHAMRAAKVFVHAIRGTQKFSPRIQRQGIAEAVLEARRRQDCIEHKLRRKLPAQPECAEQRILAVEVQPDASHELKIGTDEIGTAKDQRDIEILGAKVRAVAIKAGLKFEPKQPGVSELKVRADHGCDGLQGVGQGSAFGKSETEMLPVESDADLRSVFQYRRSDCSHAEIERIDVPAKRFPFEFRICNRGGTEFSFPGNRGTFRFFESNIFTLRQAAREESQKDCGARNRRSDGHRERFEFRSKTHAAHGDFAASARKRLMNFCVSRIIAVLEPMRSTPRKVPSSPEE